MVKYRIFHVFGTVFQNLVTIYYKPIVAVAEQLAVATFHKFVLQRVAISITYQFVLPAHNRTCLCPYLFLTIKTLFATSNL